ncbi:MAG: hypothetical protein ACTHQE_06355 [Thermomicrobiales bacterium]
MRFSDYFGLRGTQTELDFVDVPLTTDLPLYVDPYALSLEEAEWFAVCNDLVVNFFELIVRCISEGEEQRARRLLLNLREPNDTHLGLSTGKPRGSGIGGMQSEQIFERLRLSEAVQTGMLKDLADAELVIPGIGRDKISDMTTNIIRGPLLEYTKAQCLLHNIPMRRVPGGMCWDPARGDWRSTYADLPIYETTRVLLVPKAAVRHDLTIDHQKYYQHFVLEYLQAEHLEAGSSLVQTLKTGRRVVYKTDLKEVYPLDKNFLYNFTQDHPEVLEQYKESLPPIPTVMTDRDIEMIQPNPEEVDFNPIIDNLRTIPPGNTSASAYHNAIMGALTAIFSPALVYPIKELEINEGRKRVDIAFTNRDRTGFFYYLTTVHGIHCPYIFFECKNYGREVTNPELDQLAGRFGDTRGRFGFLVCRDVADRATLIQRCRDLVRDKREFMLVLTDQDISSLLIMKGRQDYSGINAYLDGLLAELTM